MPPTLYTLTGNLLWERTLEFDAWSPGKTQRARAESFQVGGKGINVSRMLVRLGAPTEAWCFAGGSTGIDCTRWLEARGIPHRSFSARSATRIGAVIRAPGQAETTFLGPDAAPDADAWSACANAIDRLPDTEALALCGSFPGWTLAAAAPFRDALARWGARAPLIVDSYGPPLAWALEHRTALIKINRDEFDALTPASGPEPFGPRMAAALARANTRAWIVTDGPGPIWIAEANQPPLHVMPPTIQAVSPTGSGDVLLGCLLHAHFQRGLALADALRFALPYAAANAAHPGVADFDLNHLPA